MQGSKDRWVWKWNNEGRYTVKSCVFEIYRRKDFQILPLDIIKRLWNKGSPPRAQVLVWFVLIGKIKTGDLLLKISLIREDQAYRLFCKIELESIKHVVFNCHVVWQVWMGVCRWWSVSVVLHEDAIANFRAWRALLQGKQKGEWWSMLFFTTIWSLWFNRNKRKFEGTEMDVGMMIEEIKLRFCSWLKSFYPKSPYASVQIQQNVVEALGCYYQ